MRRLLLVIASLVLAGCGGEDRVTVFAASSLREALPALDPSPRYSFAGSGELRRQVEAGAPADVFAGASTEDAQRLHAAGRCGRPRVFAGNRLVLIVPARGVHFRAVDDLRRGGLRLAVGGPAVPVGRYARQALERMGFTRVIERNEVSAEASTAGITAKVAAGVADAGFAYVTDARAAGARVRTIELPPAAQPRVRYAACAVTGRGRAYLDRLAGPQGRAVLERHGFTAP